MNSFAKLAALAAMAGALSLAGAAQATVIPMTTYNFDQSNAFPGVTTGTVTVSGTDTDIHFVIDLNSPYQLIDSGSHFLFTGNLGGTINAASTQATLPSGMSVTLGSNISNAPFNSAFDFAINCGTACGPGGSSPFGPSLSFDVIGTNLSILQATTFNSKPIYFASDMAGAGGNTGVVGATSIPGVPEPATWALMITGVGMAGYALRRRRVMASVAA